MARQKLKHDLSLRAKFKDDNVVELVVIDHDTSEEFLFNFKFRSGIIASATQVKDELDEVTSDDEVIANDEDSNNL